MHPGKTAGRVFLYILGQFFIALGVTVAVNSNMGVAPVNSFPYIVSQILEAPLSVCVFVVYTFYLLLQMLLLRRDFKPLQLTQLVFSALFGYFVSFAGWLLGDFCLPGMVGRYAMMVLSMPIMSLGLALYLYMDLIPMPMEGLCLAIHQRFPKMAVHNAKTMMDCFSVGMAILLSLLFFHRLVGVREGTIISAVLVGKMIPLVRKPLLPLLKRFYDPHPVEGPEEPAQEAAPQLN